MFRTHETKESLDGKSGIYLITLRGSLRFYVGQSISLWKRIASHIREAHCEGRGAHCKIQRAIRKYGSEAFDFSILAFCDPGNLNGLEEYFILRFNSAEPHGFNIHRTSAHVASGGHLSEEHRRKISEANKGRKRSDETRARMRASFKGRKMSEAQKEHLRRIKTGTKLSASHKAAITATTRLQRSRPVDQISIETGEIIATFPSIMEAAKQTGSDNRNISNVLKGRAQTCNGFIWSFHSLQAN